MSTQTAASIAPPPIYTTLAVGAILHLKPATVRRYIARGWLPAVRVGKRWMVGGADLNRLLSEGTPRRR
jgi:hypothetical protein